MQNIFSKNIQGRSLQNAIEALNQNNYICIRTSGNENPGR